MILPTGGTLRQRMARMTAGPVGASVLIGVAAYALWTALAFPLETPWERIVDDAAMLPFRLGIALVALAVARHPATERPARLAWQLLGVAFLMASLSNVLRLVPWAGGGLPGSVRAGFAVVQLGPMLASLWLLARLRRDRERVADWLDACVIVLAVFLLATEFVAGGNPFVVNRLGSLRWLFLLYLCADLVALFLAAAAWFRRPQGISRQALGLLTLGFAVLAVVDLQYDQEIQRGTWQKGGLLDVGLAIGFGLVILAVDRQRRLPPSAEEPFTAIREGRHVVAPLAILAAVIPTLVLAWNPSHVPQHLAFQVTGMTILIVLVLLRQHLVRVQTVRLARERVAADARFRSLVQRSSDAILQLSVDHVVEWASPSAGELAGSIPALVVGRKVVDLAHPEDRDRLTVFLANAGEPFARNAALRWRMGRDERWHDVESVVSDLAGDDSTSSLVLNTRNVTERVRLEQQLRQSQKLEAVGRLAGGIAHDFNNILAAIITHAQLVQDGLPPEDQRAADLREIEQTAQRGAVLTRRLLSFSRPELGESRTQALGAVLTGMEPMLSRLLVGQVDLKLDLGPDDLWVRTADGQIEQILMNLAINARDAMPEGGTVFIQTRALTIRPGEPERAQGLVPGRWADLRVRDTGIGMDERTLAHLFEPFFTTKPSGLGTGLGLSTVRGIVRALGGQVRADSAPGAGTTMRVLLPLTAPEIAAAPVPQIEEPTAVHGRPTVLIVDDEVTLRRATERFLERYGYAVIAAPSAVEALAILDAREWRVDLVVTDMVMPGMDGREFVRRLRARRPSLPVVCMSGHMEWGADDLDGAEAPWSPKHLLAKPFSFHELVKRVRDALGEAPAVGAGAV